MTALAALTPIQITQIAVSLSLVVAGGCAFLFWALRPGSRLSNWMDAAIDEATTW